MISRVREQGPSGGRRGPGWTDGLQYVLEYCSYSTSLAPGQEIENLELMKVEHAEGNLAL